MHRGGCTRRVDACELRTRTTQPSICACTRSRTPPSRRRRARGSSRASTQRAWTSSTSAIRGEAGSGICSSSSSASTREQACWCRVGCCTRTSISMRRSPSSSCGRESDRSSTRCGRSFILLRGKTSPGSHDATRCGRGKVAGEARGDPARAGTRVEIREVSPPAWRRRGGTGQTRMPCVTRRPPLALPGSLSRRGRRRRASSTVPRKRRRPVKEHF